MNHLAAADEYADVYVGPNAYKPENMYFNLVKELLPLTWRIRQDFYWTYVLIPGMQKMVQGWKIHISATPNSAIRVLEKVIPILCQHQLEFKFTSDPAVLRLALNKNSPRSAAGKFLTIYPNDTAIFKQVIEELYLALRDQKGPYILSDRQYKDSQVVFYRYGGFWSMRETTADGKSRECILDPQFRYHEDVRSHRFVLPAFIEDELLPSANSTESGAVASTSSAPTSSAKIGDYSLSVALKFSNAGGVYQGQHLHSGTPVILKEARPFIDFDVHGNDALSRLQKEYRILKKLEGTQIAAKPYALFQVWEHQYLAQEVVPGLNLQAFQARKSPFLFANASLAALQDWLHTTLTLSLDLLKKIKLMHAHGIIFGDISLKNIIVAPDHASVRLIDFEAAYEPGVDQPINIITQGFATKERMARDHTEWRDDYYALGAVVLSFFTNNLVLNVLKPEWGHQIIAELKKDIHLPDTFAACINHLQTEKNADLDWVIAQLSMQLQALPTSRLRALQATSLPERSEVMRHSQAIAQRVFAYCAYIGQFQKNTHVFPFGEKFQHALALDYGVTGVAYAWHKVVGQVPDALRQWLALKADSAPQMPGLRTGCSGFAWVLAALGLDQQAKAVLHSASTSPLLFEKSNLGYGSAGYGMCNLQFWQTYREPAYLAEACKIAEILCASALPQEHGLCWEDPTQGEGAELGFWGGNSGIALFLLYAWCVSQNPRFLHTGKEALRFEMQFQVAQGESIYFPRHNRNLADVVSPHMEYGTAGIASVALRYYAATQEADYAQFVQHCVIAAANKFPICPGYAMGLAGMGNFLLDAYQFLQDERCLQLAIRNADMLRLHEVQRQQGSCFVAMYDPKLNTDYFTGSSGIGLYLHRLASNGKNENFMIDSIIEDFTSTRLTKNKAAIA